MSESRRMRQSIARRLDPFADVRIPEDLHGEAVGVARNGQRRHGLRQFQRFKDAGLRQPGVLARNGARQNDLEPFAPERAGDVDVRERHGGISALDHDCLSVPFEGSAPHEPRTTREHGSRRTPVNLRPAIISSRAAPASRPKRFEIHVDAGERRPGRRRHHVPIVEADHRYVTRHGETHLAQSVDRAARDLIVAAEERVGRVLPTREERLRGLAAPSLRPAAGQGWQRRQAGLGDCAAR